MREKGEEGALAPEEGERRSEERSQGGEAGKVERGRATRGRGREGVPGRSRTAAWLTLHFALANRSITAACPFCAAMNAGVAPSACTRTSSQRPRTSPPSSSDTLLLLIVTAQARHPQPSIKEK